MPFARALLFVFCSAALAADIDLPAPQTEGGKPLMQALRLRRSSREFSPEKLSPQVMSNLLWAAFGVNRAHGGRTAPSAHNWQEIDIYVATAEGVFVYEPKPHRLRQVAAGDVRALAGTQDFVAKAPVNLVYAADLAKTGSGEGAADERAQWVAADAGFIGQNVYLFCASEGLATVVRAGVQRPEFAKAAKLRPEQRIILAQTVGYPGK